MGKVNLQMYSFMDGTMNDSRENFRRWDMTGRSCSGRILRSRRRN